MSSLDVVVDVLIKDGPSSCSEVPSATVDGGLSRTRFGGPVPRAGLAERVVQKTKVVIIQVEKTTNRDLSCLPSPNSHVSATSQVCETSESINSRRNFGVIGVRRINRVGLGRTGIRSPLLSLSSTGPLYTCN